MGTPRWSSQAMHLLRQLPSKSRNLLSCCSCAPTDQASRDSNILARSGSSEEGASLLIGSCCFSLTAAFWEGGTLENFGKPRGCNRGCNSAASCSLEVPSTQNWARN